MIRIFLTTLSIVATTLVLTGFALVDDDAGHPNIIVIMADDLGYGDVSCYGASAIQTPNIDRLALQGQRFTSGYCSASTCTPTRYSFLTGNYAFRHPNTGIAPPNGPAIIQPGTETVASILRRAGYRTAVIGKWHLGLGEDKLDGQRTKRGEERRDGHGPQWNYDLKPGPLEIGFDTCYLLPTTNDRVPQVYVKDHRVVDLDPEDPLWVGSKSPSNDHPTGVSHRHELKMDWSHGHNETIHNGISRIGFYTGGHEARFRDEDLADKWIEKSNEFIEQNRDQPFFLFFASHDLHVPRMPHERFQGQSELGLRGDAILELDWSVGELMKTLDRLELNENTLVVFCSDNGPVLDDGYQDGAVEQIGSHRAAGPYKGGKYSVYEGGTRTPFITRWTGTIPAGESDAMVCTIDCAASFASMCDQALSDDACTDSFDVLDALLGKPEAAGRDHLVQQDNGGADKFGFRVLDNGRDWKLVRHGKRFANNTVVEQKLEQIPVPELQLFDLAADPGETNDVIDQHPEVATKLSNRLKQIIDAGSSR